MKFPKIDTTLTWTMGVCGALRSASSSILWLILLDKLVANLSNLVCNSHNIPLSRNKTRRGIRKYLPGY